MIRQETIFDTIRILIEKGMSVREAIAEWEVKSTRPISEDLKALIYQECQ